MTQEQKDLLLKDLCARLPYGVKVSTPDDVSRTIKRMNIDSNLIEVGDYIDDVYVLSDIKPYLFPLTSMTDEQKEEHKDLLDNQYSFDADGNIFTLQDFYCKYNLDFRGLIDKGYAIDATGLNIY